MNNLSSTTLKGTDLEDVSVTIDLPDVVSDSIEMGSDIDELLTHVHDETKLEFVADQLERSADWGKMYDMFTDRINHVVLVRILNNLQKVATEQGLTTPANLAGDLELIRETLAIKRGACATGTTERFVAHDRMNALTGAIDALKAMAAEGEA